MSQAAVAHLLQKQQVWRASQGASLPSQGSGWAPLDARLPGGGFPRGAVSEILCAAPGSGELGLLLPLLARLSRQGKRQLALINPPFPAYAPGLAGAGVDLQRLLIINPQTRQTHRDALWAAEQCLASGLFAALLLYGLNDATHTRRLQLAAREADALAFSFRPLQAATQPSPAALRLKLIPTAKGVDIEVLKCRGPAGARISLLQNAYGRFSETPADAPACNSAASPPQLAVVS